MAKKRPQIAKRDPEQEHLIDVQIKVLEKEVCHFFMKGKGRDDAKWKKELATWGGIANVPTHVMISLARQLIRRKVQDYFRYHEPEDKQETRYRKDQERSDKEVRDIVGGEYQEQNGKTYVVPVLTDYLAERLDPVELIQPPKCPKC